MRSQYLVALLPLAAFAHSFPSPHKVKEELSAPPRGWMIHSPAPVDHFIQLRIALPQPNFHLLEEHLYAVSDPEHERYGEHLSKEEVEELVAPHPESVNAIDEWLASHGIEGNIGHSPAGDWLTIRIPLSKAEEMLNTKYHVWQHTDGEYLVRTTFYSLPAAVYDHVDLIQPTTLFGRFKPQNSSLTSPIHVENLPTLVDRATGLTVNASCNTEMTITCLREIYNATGYTPSADVGNSIGVTGYLENYANTADLQRLYEDQVPAAAAVNSTFKFISVNGGVNSQNLSRASIEANLDTQFAFGLSFPIASTFYSTRGQPPFVPSLNAPTDTNEPYSEWLDFVLSHPDPPLVISTSYSDAEETVPESYARRACAGFAQLGAQGVTLIVSSGDFGVGDGDSNPATQTCMSNDETNRTQFIPGFPASCPFVTTVGGTVFFNPEISASFTGGGFSRFFSRPRYTSSLLSRISLPSFLSYQDAAVKGFLDQLPNSTYEGLFNPDGRAFPDVSAQSASFRMFLRGEVTHQIGTSASAPAFAGLVALLNDARLKAGLPPLGFLNPLLYSKAASGFNDITLGHNPGCGTDGFNATEGWDAVSGLGTPDFGKLLKLVT
ncbi:subtilisin-like protein [Roridomyces roridus]|uniref:tripeptidyl-peptidase II n=1 Tax=Roridomyces roridus TaxID=1738132 RepID=A0AAD7C5P1_9AGAR|nr:subtilisin-like protein [Roridomyces roridus]